MNNFHHTIPNSKFKLCYLLRYLVLIMDDLYVINCDFWNVGFWYCQKEKLLFKHYLEISWGKKDFLSNKMRKLLQQHIDVVEMEGGQRDKNRVKPSCCHIPRVAKVRPAGCMRPSNLFLWPLSLLSFEKNCIKPN